jgi:ATP-dependent Clp protease ATP-binding subunit ClpA
MFDRAELYQWRCVRTVIDVVDQMSGRWFARGPMVLDETSVGLLLLWSWLRFESDFLTRCLDELGVNIEELTQQVDAMLCERKVTDEAALAGRLSPRDPAAARTMHDLTAAWLGRAADEAGIMYQGYVGIEHFLLAFLHTPTSPIASLFSQFRLDYERFKNAIEDTIRGRQIAKEAAVDALIVDARTSVPPWQAISGRPAVGLPSYSRSCKRSTRRRRFSDSSRC